MSGTKTDTKDYAHHVFFFRAKNIIVPPVLVSMISLQRANSSPVKDELNLKGYKGNYKGMDIKDAQLLLTAAKVGCMLMCRVHEELQDYAMVRIVEAVVEHKKAKLGVIRAMKDQDLKNKDPNADSLVDFSNSEDDKSSETLSDSGRMKRVIDEGEVVVLDIDLNEECH
ncbi:hypothetical protein L2E82_23179 [Cichorium intybus]|uniref:Uncharacterized protein n=1 Tax=Cichorium intybus TaxID=13427 RepID=A0ACB9E071_CICIN|nr:hypothetical protein L2E82_23179 [Cichorium intybus]